MVELGYALSTPASKVNCPKSCPRAYFAQAVPPVREDDVADLIVCGSDPAKHIEKIQAFAKAGYDHVYVYQVGPDQEGFFRFYKQEVLPKFR
jgi:hypothetical protein